MCTNRHGALDPAILRRAAVVLKFARPDDEQRRAALEPLCKAIELSDEQINDLVEATGPSEHRRYGFSFSDLVQRLLPAILLDAYPNDKIRPGRAIEIAQHTAPTAPFQEEAT